MRQVVAYRKLKTNYNRKLKNSYAQKWSRSLNPLNLNIKIQILICYPHTFSIEVVGRNW